MRRAESSNSLLSSTGRSADGSDLEKIKETYQRISSSLERLVPVVRSQLELLDDLDLGSEKNNSFLYSLVQQLLELKSRFIVKSINDKGFDQVIAKAVETGEVDVGRDGVIFSKRGGRKTDIRTVGVRRMSFASTSYNDQTVIVHKDQIKTMTDLDFIFYLNAYHLPYCNKNEGRSMYESFFSSIIKIATGDYGSTLEEQNSEETVDSLCFAILQEAIAPIAMVTEYSVSITECILEMFLLLNNRIKTAVLSIDAKIEIKEFQNTMFEHVIQCFSDSKKIFLSMRKRKITSSINETDGISPRSDSESNLSPSRSKSQPVDLSISLPPTATTKDRYETKDMRSQLRSSVNWSSKMANYNDALLSALESYTMSVDSFIFGLTDLKTRVGAMRVQNLDEYDSKSGALIIDDRPHETSPAPKEIKETDQELLAKMEQFLSDAAVYIREFKNFITLLQGGQVTENSGYGVFSQKGSDLLNILGELQERYPMRYGGLTPRSLRGTQTSLIRSANGRRSTSGSRSSGGSSPRSSDLEAVPGPVSPREVSPRTSLNTSQNGEQRSVFGRVLASITGRSK